MLMNTDYNIVARIIASRTRPGLVKLLHPSQYYGVPGKTIFEASATVQDAITYADVANILLCVLPLDFKEAFDEISHTYLLTILQSHGYNDAFIERIKNMYNNATSVVQINGHIPGPIPIHCSV
jgi:hypothetical protein